MRDSLTILCQPSETIRDAARSEREPLAFGNTCNKPPETWGDTVQSVQRTRCRFTAVTPLVLAAAVAWAAEPVRGDTLNPQADPSSIIVEGNARFTILAPDLIRLEWSPEGKFEDRASQVVVNRRLPTVKFEKAEGEALDPTGKSKEETTPDPKVLAIRTDRFDIRYRRDGKPFDKGNLIVRARVGEGGAEEWWVGSPPFEQCANLGGTIRTLDGVSGSCEIDRGLLNRYGWSFLDDSKTLVLDNSDWPWATQRHSEDATDWYFFAYGQDYKRVLTNYTSIAGRVPLPPKYVFGAWWSRYWAYSDAELRELVNDFKSLDVPLDVLVIDMDWHLDGWTGYTWNPKYFPDPKGFLDWAHGEGLKVTLNLHPAEGVGKHEAAFPEMCKALGLDPEKTDRVAFDCADRKFVDAYFKYLHHPMEKMGIDFWWMDWQQGTDTKIKGLDPLWWLNYLHWTDMERRASQTGRRPLIFSRWGGLGNHRYQIGFSGDTFCNWPSLAFQPYFTSTAANVCYDYWSHDIGGHQPGKVDPELYTRWIQWGALSPILRTHTTKNPEAERRIWKFAPEYFSAMKRAFNLRYQLIPYIYTMARKCFDTSLPLCRPLYYEWPDLEESYAHKNEYLFGDDLLVAPITEPADPVSGCAMVEVWLPPGRWINWFTGRQYEGPTIAAQVVPLDQIPIFAREGAIIPMLPHGRHRADGPADELEIVVFPGDSSERVLYEDDGISSGYAEGKYARTRISQKWTNGRRTITIEPSDGEYEGKPKERSYLVHVLDRSPLIYEVLLEGKPLNSKSGDVGGDQPFFWYNPIVMGPSIRIPAKPTNRRIEIDIGESEELHRAASSLNGFRGLMFDLCAANRTTKGALLGTPYDCGMKEWVFKLMEGRADSVIDQWKEAWPANLDGVRGMGLTPEEETKALLQLLGLYHKLTITPKDGGGGYDVQLSLRSLQPIPAMEEFDGAAVLTADNPWKVEGETEKSFVGIAEHAPVVLKASLTGGDANTAVVRARISLRRAGVSLELPIETVILPSINAWQVIGPFDAPFEKALSMKLPPEEKIDLKAKYTGKDGHQVGWKKVERVVKPGEDLMNEFFMDFDDVFGGRVYEAACYALTYLESPQEMDASLGFGSDDGAVVWMNGAEVFRIDTGRAYSSKSDRIPVKLKKGTNELLVKVKQGGGDWGLCVHVETPEGRPLPAVKARASQSK